MLYAEANLLANDLERAFNKFLSTLLQPPFHKLGTLHQAGSNQVGHAGQQC